MCHALSLLRYLPHSAFRLRTSLPLALFFRIPQSQIRNRKPLSTVVSPHYAPCAMPFVVYSAIPLPTSNFSALCVVIPTLSRLSSSKAAFPLPTSISSVLCVPRRSWKSEDGSSVACYLISKKLPHQLHMDAPFDHVTFNGTPHVAYALRGATVGAQAGLDTGIF